MKTLSIIIIAIVIFFIIYGLSNKRKVVVIKNTHEFIKAIDSEEEKLLILENGIYITGGNDVTVPPNIDLKIPFGESVSGGPGSKLTILGEINPKE
jgi:lipopolysaccharide export LptBFGC system permease protein LptF